MARARIDEVRDLSTTCMNLPANYTAVDFTPKLTECCITEDLNGGSAVVMVWKDISVAMVTNIPPKPTNEFMTPEQFMAATMDGAALLRTIYCLKFGIPRVFITYAEEGGKPKYPELKKMMVKKLEAMDLVEYTEHPYTLGDRDRRTPGHGTIVVDARNGTPEVYLHNKRVDE